MRSKWGSGPVVEHTPDVVPSGYLDGGHWEVRRKCGVCINEYEWVGKGKYRVNEKVKVVKVTGTATVDGQPVNEGDVIDAGKVVTVEPGGSVSVEPGGGERMKRALHGLNDCPGEYTAYVEIIDGLCILEEYGTCEGTMHCGGYTPLTDFWVAETPGALSTIIEISHDSLSNFTRIYNSDDSPHDVVFSPRVGPFSGACFAINPGGWVGINSNGTWFPVVDRISTTQGLTFAWYRNGEIMDDEWSYRLILGDLWETRWETHTGKLDFREDHPEWDDQAVDFSFYEPSGAEGWRQTVFPLPKEGPDTTFPSEPVMYRRPAGGGSPPAGADLNAGVSDVYAFNLSGTNDVSWRIPDLARVSEGDDLDTIYTVVDLSLYCAANPDGFAEGKWQVGDQLTAHDVEIVDGHIAGLEGVMWATRELDYGGLSREGYKSMASSTDLLNSGDKPGELVIVAEHSGGITDLTVECDCGVWGDINGDDAVDPTDVMCLVYHVYQGRDIRIQPANCPYESGDANCDGQTDPMDMISLINHVYKTRALPCQDPCD
ncbi:dockerin type I domain-containing protein [Candidatus Zixiibacteriota bacterium]